MPLGYTWQAVYVPLAFAGRLGVSRDMRISTHNEYPAPAHTKIKWKNIDTFVSS